MIFAAKSQKRKFQDVLVSRHDEAISKQTTSCFHNSSRLCAFAANQREVLGSLQEVRRSNLSVKQHRVFIILRAFAPLRQTNVKFWAHCEEARRKNL